MKITKDELKQYIREAFNEIKEERFAEESKKDVRKDKKETKESK